MDISESLEDMFSSAIIIKAASLSSETGESELGLLVYCVLRAFPVVILNSLVMTGVGTVAKHEACGGKNEGPTLCVQNHIFKE